jgi:hypothetical protein
MPTNTENTINGLKTEIVRVVTAKLSAVAVGNHDIDIAWKQKQVDAATEIITLLKKHLPNSTITPSASKSVYPDIKIKNTEGEFAIDIKANEDTKNPWFDMARLDTINEARLSKFVEEWELVIKYKSANGAFIKAYFNLFREVVGYNAHSKGVKYRPYDGKLRPKTWADFDSNTIYWNTKEKVLDGIDKSIKYRWKSNISKHLVLKLSAEEKAEFKQLFDNPTEFPEEADDDNDAINLFSK